MSESQVIEMMEDPERPMTWVLAEPLTITRGDEFTLTYEVQDTDDGWVWMPWGRAEVRRG